MAYAEAQKSRGYTCIWFLLTNSRRCARKVKVYRMRTLQNPLNIFQTQNNGSRFNFSGSDGLCGF